MVVNHWDNRSRHLLPLWETQTQDLGVSEPLEMSLRVGCLPRAQAGTCGGSWPWANSSVPSPWGRSSADQARCRGPNPPELPKVGRSLQRRARCPRTGWRSLSRAPGGRTASSCSWDEQRLSLAGKAHQRGWSRFLCFHHGSALVLE